MTETYSFNYLNKGIKKFGEDYQLKVNNYEDGSYIDIVKKDDSNNEKIICYGKKEGWVPFGAGGKVDIDTLEKMSQKISELMKKDKSKTEVLSDWTKDYNGLERAVATSIIILSIALISISSLRMTGNIIAESSKITNYLIIIIAIILVILGVLFNKKQRKRKQITKEE
ncbi:MAG: hypothetical protein ACOC3Z_00095 [Nanoarchaeota archaeon]